MRKILFFSPFSNIWEHSFPEALIAESLNKSGFEVIYVTCGGCLNSYCSVMASKDLPYNSSKSEKNKVCTECIKTKDLIVNKFKFKGHELKKWINDTDIKEVDKILETINQSNYLNLEIDGIQIGRIAIYELLLKYKKISLDFNNTEWQHYLLYLRSTLISFYACKKIISFEKPESVVVYNSLYSINAVCCKIAQKQNIEHYFMHAGTNLSNQHGSLLIGKGFTWRFLRGVVSSWPKLKNIPSNKEQITYSTNHILELLKANNIFVYSSQKSNKYVDIRKIFSINFEQKIFVASMSSYDERFAVETIGAFSSDYELIFDKQIDWIKSLVEWFSTKKEYFLIIRVHPREFPNKRDNVTSHHAFLLQELFASLPSNIKVDWPENKISLYDLALETDVFLNAWSSVGKEVSALGIPVVVYSPDLLLYPSDLNYVGTSKIDYFIKIEQALREGWSEERIVKTFRWLSLEFSRSQISIRESFTGTQLKITKNYFVRIYRKIMRIIFPNYLKIKSCKLRKEFLNSSALLKSTFYDKLEMPLDSYEIKQETSIEEEKVFLKIEMKKILNQLCGDDYVNINRTKLIQNLKRFIEN